MSAQFKNCLVVHRILVVNAILFGCSTAICQCLIFMDHSKLVASRSIIHIQVFHLVSLEVDWNTSQKGL